MLGKVRTVLGLINTVINVLQLGLLGKKAIESEQGQKVVKKTVEVGKDVGKASAEVTGTAYRHVQRTVGDAVTEVGTRIDSVRGKKKEAACESRDCPCNPCECDPCECGKD